VKDTARQTRTYLMDLFAEHGFHPRTDLGQNFLIDLNLVEFVVNNAQLGPDDVVLEIGAGTGGMTTFLAKAAGHVVSVELDANMYALASKVTGIFENVTLLHTDALANKNTISETVLDEVRRQLALSPARRLKLVANLPYNIATPVVSNLVASELPWARMVVTIQKELGDRMIARPNTSPYGALAVWLQAQCEVTVLRKLGNTVFWPRPKVDSAIVQLVPDREARAKIVDRPFFQDYVRRLFHHRRKLMRGVLAGMYRKQISKPDLDALLASLGLEEKTRAETLDVPTHVRVANALHAATSV
jgi:16S rRNA (adenine1518-N6/adenine1519-N6)-dimethyltransferase